ncbi:MAG: site-specific integrase [Acidobacteria bacterium]|nr:site-specific integrase [Acidobacteriota bacterium]
MRERKGYVFEANGKCYARVTYTDGTGKRRNIKRRCENRAVARKLLKTLVRDLDDGNAQAVAADKMKFAELVAYYEEYYAIPAKFLDGRKVEGLRDYAKVRYYLQQFRRLLGNRKLKELGYEDVSRYRRIRLEEPTRHGTQRCISSVNRELAYLRRVLNVGVRLGWIVKNPFNSGDVLIDVAAEKRRERILTLEEERNLLEACTGRRARIKPLLICLLDTGARVGETKKLTFSDIDFEKRLITYRATNTKTMRERKVAMTQRVFELLNSIAANGEVQPEKSVFEIKSFRKAFTSACLTAGIETGKNSGVTPHSLRHTAAVRLVKGQMSIQMVGRILGHQSPQTTYRYLSANNETLYEAASILERVHQQGDQLRRDLELAEEEG